MGWATVWSWTRNLFAAIGLLGSVLVTALVALAVAQERAYEERASAASQRETKPTLESAHDLTEMAGLDPGKAKRLIGGLRPDWNRGDHVEAYCVEADIGAATAPWRAIPRPETNLGPSIAKTLEVAHTRLDCIPTATDVATRGLEVRLISAQFGNEGLEAMRVAVRDPGAGLYYLVADTAAASP